MRGFNFLSFLSSVVLLALMVFSVLQYLNISVGNFVDWVVGIASFVWLITIVTLPWNIYFEASEVINTAAKAKKRNIEVDETSLPYLERVRQIALGSALLLHLATAAGLYYLAMSGISEVGYYAAAAALGLTFFRPLARLYEYLSEQLRSIRHEINYPVEDVATLKLDLSEAKKQIEALQNLLDETDAASWRSQLEAQKEALKQAVHALNSQLTQALSDNAQEHTRLAQETHQAVARLTADGQFINNLVEIIRFVKRV